MTRMIVQKLTKMSLRTKILVMVRMTIPISPCDKVAEQ